jgi:hypothetical protein
MTESEAKTKWCPMVRLSTENGSNITFNASENHRAHCIGSACMMWQWHIKMYDGPPEDFITRQEPSGRCGLAR